MKIEAQIEEYEVVEKKNLISAAKKYILDGGKAIQPWDEKGFRLPSGAPYTPKGMMIWGVASSSLRKMSYGNYPAQNAILSALYEGVQVPIDAGLRIEARQMTKVLMDPVSQNMVRSLFVNMQALNKGARRPKDFENVLIIIKLLNFLISFISVLLLKP